MEGWDWKMIAVELLAQIYWITPKPITLLLV